MNSDVRVNNGVMVKVNVKVHLSLPTPRSWEQLQYFIWVYLELWLL
jgi:hypothetical protein